MPKVTATQASERLGAGIRNGQTAYTQGVNAVTENPAQKAIANKQKWVNAMTNPETHARWENGLGRVTLANWKQTTAGTGAQRFAQSADKAQSRYQAFAQDFFPFLQNVEDQVNAMPSVTLEERIAKAVANMRLIATYERP